MARTNHREYSFNGLAGCVVQRRSQITRTLVGIYHGEQSGMESDSEMPWLTVCEVHHSCVCHSTLVLARSHAANPTGWCEECRKKD